VNGPPNRRDDEVRRLLNTPHPAVPVDLAARAVQRGRRIVRRRRVEHTALWLLLLAAAVTGIVLAVLAWPDGPSTDAPTDTPWWSSVGSG
jgi:ferric-dicitrate binding protein FerR (iron transport regulator)